MLKVVIFRHTATSGNGEKKMANENEIKPNKQLANKRVELIEMNFRPTGNDVIAEFENGFRVFENWKNDTHSVMIIVDKLSNGIVINVDWIYC